MDIGTLLTVLKYALQEPKEGLRNIAMCMMYIIGILVNVKFASLFIFSQTFFRPPETPESWLKVWEQERGPTFGSSPLEAFLCPLGVESGFYEKYSYSMSKKFNLAFFQ